MPDHPVDPRLECDVVMKGGITSGVIYPGTVCALARIYRLRSIGGASAGAIAAAAAAAAEYGRESGGFSRLETVPARVGQETAAGGSVLHDLFQPSRRTAPLLALARSGARRTRVGRASAAVACLVRCAPLPTLAGVLPGAAVLVLGALGGGVSGGAAIAAGIVLALAGALVGAALGTVRRAGRDVPANGFGLCSGMPATEAAGAPAALVPWLHDLLQDLAGAPPAPLTFGDLRARGCDLRMMTTDLTHRRPVEMPWDQRGLFFDPTEFRRLFPEDVVQWLEDHPPALPTDPGRRWASQLLRLHAGRLRPLPQADDLPVLVATRMSLSFPFLISAVPLHTVDYGEPGNREAREQAAAWRAAHRDATPAAAVGEVPAPRFTVHWFSDGGICTNLPVHFFDRPLPRRPTFAIDLAPFPPGRARSSDERENVWLPQVNQGGLLRRTGVWPTRGIGALTGFAGAILASARSWVDESLIVTPGYRDRVVTIYQADDEGGLNLAMSEGTVAGLAARGYAAGELLRERFAGAEPGCDGEGWRNQQWIRYRTAMAGLDDWVRDYADGFRDPTTAYPALFDDAPSYRMTAARRAAASARTEELLDLADHWAEPPADAFARGAPAPPPVLRLVPADRAGVSRSPDGGR